MLSCSLATSTWMAHTIWHLGCAKGVAVGAPAVESKGNRGAIWVESMHKSLQKFCEAAEVCVFM